MAFRKAHLNTILAALRYYQASGQGEPVTRSTDIDEIATDGGTATALDAIAIDRLCENLNCSDFVGAMNLYPKLKAFTAQVARMTTPTDGVTDDDKASEIMADLDDERLCSDASASYDMIREARRLTGVLTPKPRRPLGDHVTNEDRAVWASEAIAAYAEATGGRDPEQDAEELIADMIGDSLHRANQLGLHPIEIAQHGIGMWSAEDRAEDDTPHANDIVMIDITKAEDVA